MPLPLQRISPGMPLPGNSVQWNQIIDSVDTSRQLNEFGRSAQWREWWANAIKVAVPTVTNNGVTAGQYIVAGASLTDPTNGEPQFLNDIIFRGIAPDWTAENWGKAVIAVNGIPQDTIGYFHFSGVTRAKVTIEADWHGYCDIDVNNTLNLRSHPSGTWKILWTKATAGGDADWSLVRYEGVWQRELKCQVPTGEELAPASSLLVNVTTDGADPDDTKQITVDHNWFDQDGDAIGSESKLLAKWFPGELKWVVVAAEC